MTISRFHTFKSLQSILHLQFAFTLNVFFFAISFLFLLFVLLFVAIVIIVVVMFFILLLFFLQVVYRRQGRTLVPSVVPVLLLCNDLLLQKFAESDTGYIRSKRGIVQP